jgi:DNA invertase Pin-like site-specific DNA recombinase
MEDDMARIGYLRVSTTDQNTDRQELGAVDKVFEDKISGKNLDRPELTKLLEYVRGGDTIVVYSIDRLARSVLNLLELVEELQRKGVSLEFIKDKLRFVAGQEASPQEKLMLQILGAFGEFERNIIRARQSEGIAIAKARGKYKGSSPRIDREAVQGLLAKGLTKAAVAKKLGISRQSVHRIVDELNEKPST